MKLSIGIVGLPNVGKSTLFQAITKKQVNIANYPFCTIDPSVGVVSVVDNRVDQLSKLTNSAKKTYTTIEFYDIAGLVKDANKGEGLGNKFLANIRETDAIVYVLRSFLKKDIINTQTKIDPLFDKEILDTELILKDLETIEKRINNLHGDLKLKKKETLEEIKVLEKIKNLLEQGKILSEQSFADEENKIIRNYQLLTDKPRFYILNGKKEEIPDDVIKDFEKNNWDFLIVDILLEFELANTTEEERKELGLSEETQLDNLIKKAYKILGLITFFTTGEDETRAWTIKKGQKATQAAGLIHSDFEKNFIKANVINWQDLVEVNGFAKAREKGLIRIEGKEYIVADGDVMEIKHNS